MRVGNKKFMRHLIFCQPRFVFATIFWGRRVLFWRCTAKCSAAIWSFVPSAYNYQVRLGQACTPILGRRRNMYPTNVQICYTKVNQIILCTAKLNEWFAMLIPKAPIHGSIRPLPQAFVSAIRLKFRLPMEMWATDSVCSSRAPTQNSSNPTLLR